MTSKNTSSKQRPQLRGSLVGGDVTALHYVDAQDREVTVWLGPVSGKLEVIGLEILPCQSLPSKSRKSALIDRADADWTRRTAERLEQWQSLVAAGKTPPIPYSKLRGLSFRQFFSDVAKQEELRSRTAEWDFSWVRGDDEANGLSADEFAQLPYLLDALTYATALLEGSQAPSHAIAAQRGISPRTAQGRVAKAREMGLLTPSKPGGRTGQLSERAEELASRISSLKDGQDG